MYITKSKCQQQNILVFIFIFWFQYIQQIEHIITNQVFSLVVSVSFLPLILALYLVQLIRTTNTNPEFLQRIFVYLLFQFFQGQVLLIFLIYLLSYIGIFLCILILIENFYFVQK